MNKLFTVFAITVLFAQAIHANAYLKNCAHCHGSQGEVSALGRSLPIVDMKEEELLDKMIRYKKGELDIYGMGGLMKAQMHNLKDGEAIEIAEYLLKVRDAKKEEKRED